LYSGYCIDCNKKSSVADENGDSYFENQKTINNNFNKIQLEIHPGIVSFLTTFEKDRNDRLSSYVAPVNRNVLNEATAYQIIHTLYGNYCHSNAGQTSQLEEMGNYACVFVSYHNKVSNTNSMNKLFETWIICSKSIFSLTP
jgi:hypothetical protein